MTTDFNFPTEKIDWLHLTGGDEFDYPVDYRLAILGSQPEVGRLDMLIEFAPNSHCHYHRHVAATTTLVLEGEQHVFQNGNDGEKIHIVRKPGDYAISAGGDVHMERGGPEGALVFFAFQTPNGKLFELLDADQNLLATTTIEELLSNDLPV